MKKEGRSGSVNLPWWTWVIPFLVLHLGSHISVLLKYDLGVTAFYLPTALSVVLIYWWGPLRVLPAVFINATMSAYLWDVSRVYLWPIYALPETILAFLSWYLFVVVSRGKFWLPDNKNLHLFLTLGILVPVVTEVGLLEGLHIYFGDQPADQFIEYATVNLLSEFTSNIGLCLPILFYLTPFMNRKNLLLYAESQIERSPPLKKNQFIEVFLLYALLVALVFTLRFEKFWFLYGLFPLHMALRFGFGQAVLMNGVILLSTYVLPLLYSSLAPTGLQIDIDMTYIYIGTILLYVFSATTGRVISDLRRTEDKLKSQNQELEQTNKELDRFVYSVSHDLSAPLKSILGLVNVSRLTYDQSEHNLYISKIESSVLKLEAFIREVLDYARNKRQELTIEQIHLRDLCLDILENLRFMEGYQNITVDTGNLEPVKIHNDRTRLKIILNNLLANAIRFQKKMPGHTPYIKISSRSTGDTVVVEIEDNGEGIKPELQNKVFDMFFRGTQRSKGSGLGLYIAREAAGKIDGKIQVKSEYGKGSVFTIELKDLSLN